jgi:hypothetical protein
VIREGGEPKVAEYKNKSGRAINEAFFDDFELYDEHMKVNLFETFQQV